MRQSHQPGSRARWVFALVGVSAALCASGVAYGAWTNQGSGSAAGTAAVMPAGQTPTAGVSGTDVTVQWPTAGLPDGTPVQGYVIRRYDATSGTAVTVGADCVGTVTTTSCVEHNVPTGSWVYTDTPVQDSWTGPESSPSSSVTV